MTADRPTIVAVDDEPEITETVRSWPEEGGDVAVQVYLWDLRRMQLR